MDRNIQNCDEGVTEDSTLVITAPIDSLEQAFSSTEKISESLLRLASETTQLLKKNERGCQRWRFDETQANHQ